MENKFLLARVTRNEVVSRRGNIFLDSVLDKIRSDGRIKKGGLIKREIKLGMYLGIGDAVRSGKIFQEHGTTLPGETRWDKRIHRTISRE